MNTLQQQIASLGVDHLAVLPTEQIRFEPSLIDLCKANSCGNYGKNWTCPPLVGDTQDLIQRARSFQTALVFQKIYRLEDSFDVEGMNAGQKGFKQILNAVKELCSSLDCEYLVLGAGGCQYCGTCAASSNQPCRFPDKQIASLESYSIQVSSLAEACGMKYINGANTVTYFGAVFT